jgi:hypothetical protein
LDLGELLHAGRVFARRLEQELSVDLNYGEEVIELVCNKACRLVRLFEVVGSYGKIDRSLLLFVLS